MVFLSLHIAHNMSIKCLILVTLHLNICIAKRIYVISMLTIRCVTLFATDISLRLLLIKTDRDYN